MEGREQRQHDLAHLRVCRFVAAQLEDVAPLTDIGRGHDLGFQTVGQHAAGLLGSGPQIHELKVCGFACLHGLFPDVVPQIVIFPEKGPDDRDLAAKLLLRVVRIAGALLGERAQAMPDQLVGHSAIADNAHGDRDVLKDTLVAELDHPVQKLARRARSDLLLGLVTGPGRLFEMLKHELTIRHVHEGKGRIDDFQILVLIFGSKKLALLQGEPLCPFFQTSGVAAT